MRMKRFAWIGVMALMVFSICFPAAAGAEDATLRMLIWEDTHPMD